MKVSIFLLFVLTITNIYCQPVRDEDFLNTINSGDLDNANVGQDYVSNLGDNTNLGNDFSNSDFGASNSGNGFANSDVGETNLGNGFGNSDVGAPMEEEEPPTEKPTWKHKLKHFAKNWKSKLNNFYDKLVSKYLYFLNY